MARLTLLYAATKDGEFCDFGDYPRRLWDVDTQFRRRLLTGNAVLCDLLCLKDRWIELMHTTCFVLTPPEMIVSEAQKNNYPQEFTPCSVQSAEEALAAMKVGGNSQIYCMGAKNIIDAAAPYASEIWMWGIGKKQHTDYTDCPEDEYYIPKILKPAFRLSRMHGGKPWKADVIEPVRGIVPSLRYHFTMNPPTEF